MAIGVVEKEPEDSAHSCRVEAGESGVDKPGTKFKFDFAPSKFGRVFTQADHRSCTWVPGSDTVEYLRNGYSYRTGNETETNTLTF